MGYTITFHKAHADAGSNNYSDIASGTVTALTAHSTITPEVRIPGKVAKEPTGDQTIFLGGEKSSITDFYRVWEMTFLTASQADNTVNDVEKYEDFLDFITDNDAFFWMDMSAYSTASGRAKTWHGAGTLIPIVFADWSTSINEKDGTETLTVKVEHRWRNK